MKLKSFELFMGLNANAMKSVQRFKAKKMRQYGLTSAHTNGLYFLQQAGKTGLTQTELVQKEMLDPSQISRVLRDLMARGYVRMDGEDGKYRRRYLLTDEGEQVAQEICEIIEEIHSFVCRDISDEEIEAFYRTFQKISGALKGAEKVYL